MNSVKQCVVCGMDYVPYRSNQKICGNPDCLAEINRWRARKYYHKKKTGEGYKNKHYSRNIFTKPNTLIEDAMAAKENGMTYGQYKGLQMIGQI